MCGVLSLGRVMKKQLSSISGKTRGPKTKLIGKKLGMLAVIARVGSIAKGYKRVGIYLVRCDCGTETTKNLQQLKCISCCGCNADRRRHNSGRRKITGMGGGCDE
jgi:hypothetical protein